MLLFTATMTVVRNGRVQEVPFDTQSEAFDEGDKRGVTLPTVAARELGEGHKVNRHEAKWHAHPLRLQGARAVCYLLPYF